MAGYAQDFSKSNNAYAAQASGRFPASILAERLGVKTAAIRALMTPCEWHHTSKHFNMTDYFEEERALELLDQLRAWRAPKTEAQIFENCSGSYLEWSGTRNHPHAKAIAFSGTRATRKGSWFTLEFPDGRTLRKGKDTRGFHLTDSNGKHLTWNL